MVETEVQDGSKVEINAKRVREQLDLLVRDDGFRSSKRSVAFLKYVVEQTLGGAADQIKERTIGVEVFDRAPSYDTNLDHVVRTAATELRKRLAIYYGEEKHRSELRIGLIPGSYIPRFTVPLGAVATVTDPELKPGQGVVSTHVASAEIGPEPSSNERNGSSDSARRKLSFWQISALSIAFLVLAIVGYSWAHRESAQDLFWKPVLETPGSVLLAVGDVPNGPPIPAAIGFDGDFPTPILHTSASATVPFADAVTIARVVGALEAKGKPVFIRRESASSFSDLREGPVVLIGAFNNEWSLRLTHPLRYSLALDGDKHLIYIKDVRNPSSRSWSWRTDQSTSHQGSLGGPVLKDYALISRIRNSETGHVVIVIGGLYTYGTDETPGLPKVVAVSVE